MLGFHHKVIYLTVASSKGKETLIKILTRQNIYKIIS